MDYAKESLRLHEQWGGKIEVNTRVPVSTMDDLSLAYTPGVAQPCLEIQRDPDKSYTLTRRHNLCAVITDGSAVLGLGDIGPEAGMPVMEGKCVLFKAFADVDAFPLCIRTKDVDEFVHTVYLLSGSFGGINLEDISAPRCFEIERKLKELCDIPVFHDDQHGTLCDRVGAIYAGRPENMNWIKTEMAEVTNLRRQAGTLADVVRDADVFIGVSQPGLLTGDMVRTMHRNAIVFACANPRRGRRQHRPQRLSEPDQQCAGLSGHLPRRVRCARVRYQRAHEARRCARTLGAHHARRAVRRLYHPQGL